MPWSANNKLSKYHTYILKMAAKYLALSLFVIMLLIVTDQSTVYRRQSPTITEKSTVDGISRPITITNQTGAGLTNVRSTEGSTEIIDTSTVVILGLYKDRSTTSAEHATVTSQSTVDVNKSIDRPTSRPINITDSASIITNITDEANVTSSLNKSRSTHKSTEPTTTNITEESTSSLNKSTYKSTDRPNIADQHIDDLYTSKNRHFF